MNNAVGSFMIVAACVMVLLIGGLRNRAEWLINFIFRAVAGAIAIYLLNRFLPLGEMGVVVGINPATVLTSGFLGFPGLILLYGINLYKFL